MRDRTPHRQLISILLALRPQVAISRACVSLDCQTEDRFNDGLDCRILFGDFQLCNGQICVLAIGVGIGLANQPPTLNCERWWERWCPVLWSGTGPISPRRGCSMAAAVLCHTTRKSAWEFPKVRGLPGSGLSMVATAGSPVRGSWHSRTTVSSDRQLRRQCRCLRGLTSHRAGSQKHTASMSRDAGSFL